MLLSDSDREQLYEKLKRHTAQGRLSVEELERRVAAIAMAQDRETAAAVMADLPPLGDESPPARPRRGRGHGDADAPAPEWRPTNERFRDPRSNRVVRVWVDSGGGRHYVAE
jgi:Domain of unknown function (DUF1707)